MELQKKFQILKKGAGDGNSITVLSPLTQMKPDLGLVFIRPTAARSRERERERGDLPCERRPTTAIVAHRPLTPSLVVAALPRRWSSLAVACHAFCRLF